MTLNRIVKKLSIILRDFIANRPLKDRFIRARALAAEQDRSWGRAENIWLELAQRTSKPSDWIGYARCCLQHGRLAKARTSLEHVLKLDSEQIPACRLLALTATRQGDWVLTASQWRTVLAADPKPPLECEALEALIRVLMELGEFNQAGALIDRLAKTETGQRVALELRIDWAEKQHDKEKLHSALDALLDNFPKATKTPKYAGLFGRTDEQSARRFTPEDLYKAPDEQTADLILSYLIPRLPKGEYLPLLRRAAGMFPDSTKIQFKYFDCLAYGLTCDSQLNELQALAQTFHERFPKHSISYRAMATAKVAANDYAAIEKMVETTEAWSGLTLGSEFLRIWLASAQGDHETARAISQRVRQKTYVRAEDSRALDLRPINAVPKKPFRDKILLFSSFRNERVFAPWFLDYYRKLGVDWFFIIDNLSNDKTDEFLIAQKDVTVFSSADDYGLAHAGIRWINELIRRHGDDNWCVYVDIDEQLVMPGGDAHGLRGLVDGMAARGEEVMPAFILDTYPERMADLQAFSPADDPLSVSYLFDTDCYFYGKRYCCFFSARGGSRERLFKTNEILEKAPIVRGGAECFFEASSHTTSYAKISNQFCVLLHHKLLHEMLDMKNNCRTSNMGLAVQSRHAIYRNTNFLDETGHVPRGPHTVAYENSAQLERLGLMGDFASIKKQGPVKPDPMTV